MDYLRLRSHQRERHRDQRARAFYSPRWLGERQDGFWAARSRRQIQRDRGWNRPGLLTGLAQRQRLRSAPQ